MFRKRWKTPPRISSPQQPRSPIKHITDEQRASARQLFSNKHLEFDNIQNNNHSSVDDTEILSNHKSVTNGNGTSHNNINKDNNSNRVMDDAVSPMRSTIKLDLFRLYRDKPFGGNMSDTLDDSLLNTSNGSEKYMFDSPMHKERHLKLVDAEKGLEMIGRALAKEKNVKWREFWNFLNEFIDIRSTDGLNKLEQYLKKKSNSNQDTNNKEAQIGTLCSALTKLEVEQNGSSSGRLPYVPKNLDMLLRNNGLPADKSPPVTPANSPNAFSAYLCAEKAWQVYAKRMTNTILHNINSVVSINDTLKAELKRLKSLICSYKEDTRFFGVDFQLAHSRFAHLIIAYISQDEQRDVIQVIVLII